MRQEKRFKSLEIAASACAVALMVDMASASSLSWDAAGGGTLGGDGSWYGGTNGNWFNGTTDGGWTGPDGAVFDGTPNSPTSSTITIAEDNVNLHFVNFNANGYVIDLDGHIFNNTDVDPNAGPFTSIDVAAGVTAQFKGDGAITTLRTISSPGTLILGDGTNLAHTYTGTGDFRTGTVVINNGAGGAGIDHDYTALNGATMRGNGVIGDADMDFNGGTVSPGLTEGSIATLANRGAVRFNTTSSVLQADLGGTAAGAYDVLAATGAVTFSAGVVNVDAVNSFAPAVGNTFDIVTGSSVTGLSNLTFNYTGSLSGDTLTPSIVNTAGGQALRLTVTSVPEPTSLGLLGIGGLALLRRRRS